MTEQPDNHNPIDETFDEIVRDAASRQPTDAQWTAAHARLRRKLVEARMEAESRRRGFPFLRALAYACGAAAVLALIAVPVLFMGGRSAEAAVMNTPGQLVVLNPDGSPGALCPLEHTDVEAKIAGFITRVHVRQSFRNPYDRPIEAVYEFPLPQGAAVDEMIMRIGPRVLVGVMKEKDEARRIYTAARAAGERTALLEQKRPNVFQQSVANIQPGERIEIEIGYNEILDYVDGRFEFVFPMVVAPRYDPRSTAGEGAGAPHGAPIGTTYADMTTTAPQTRSGHDISVTVTIAAGNMHLDQLASRLHDVAIERPAPNMAVVRLKNRVDIPNRDFVLDYNIIGDEIGDALFTRDDPRHGRFFTVILAPPKRVMPKDVVPRELFFVVDQSGSMQGWKIEKAKLAMRRCIQNLNPGDTFNLLSFSNHITRCFPASVAATPENVNAALAYLDRMSADGGTEMMPAIREALSKSGAPLTLTLRPNERVDLTPLLPTPTGSHGGFIQASNIETSRATVAYQINGYSQTRFEIGKGQTITESGLSVTANDIALLREGRPTLNATIARQDDRRTRIVAFMSDGEVGNDFEILSAVKQNAGTTRVFTFGVGNSVNRFLMETMAKTARGEAQFVTEADNPEAAADRFYVALNAPVLADVKLNWQGLQVEGMTPALPPDLFDRRPVMIHGKFKAGSPTSGTLTLTGMTGAGPFRRMIRIPEDTVATDNAALPSLWARSRVDQIMVDNPVEIQSGRFSPATRERIVGLGVEYNIMTQFTSFVAVEKNPLARPAEPVRVDVPAAKPAGESGAKRLDASNGVAGYSDSLAGQQPNTRDALVPVTDDLPGFYIGERASSPVLHLKKPEATRAQADQRTIATAIQSYYADGSSYPAQKNGTGVVESEEKRLREAKPTAAMSYALSHRQSEKIAAGRGGKQSSQLLLEARYDASNGISSNGDVYKVKDGLSSNAPAKAAAGTIQIGSVRRETVQSEKDLRYDHLEFVDIGKVDENGDAIRLSLGPNGLPKASGGLASPAPTQTAGSRGAAKGSADAVAVATHPNTPALPAAKAAPVPNTKWRGKVAADMVGQGRVVGKASLLPADADKNVDEIIVADRIAVGHDAVGTTGTRGMRAPGPRASQRSTQQFDVAQQQMTQAVEQQQMAQTAPPLQRIPVNERNLTRLTDLLTSGRLTRRQIDTVTSKALTVQAAANQPWNPAWGDWIEKARSLGKVSDADYQKFAAQSRPHWDVSAMHLADEHDGKAGIGISFGESEGRVALTPLNGGLIMAHQVVAFSIGGVPVKLNASGGAWSFVYRPKTPGVFNIYEPDKIAGLEKLRSGPCEVRLVLDERIYEQRKPGKILKSERLVLTCRLDYRRESYFHGTTGTKQ